MNNYIMINGQVINESASLEDMRSLMTQFNLKLIGCYTFKMKQGMRRVLKFEAQGFIYSVYGPRNYIDAHAYSQSCIYYGFDKTKAYSLKSDHVSVFPAKEIDFNLAKLNRNNT